MLLDAGERNVYANLHLADRREKSFGAPGPRTLDVMGFVARYIFARQRRNNARFCAAEPCNMQPSQAQARHTRTPQTEYMLNNSLEALQLRLRVGAVSVCVWVCLFVHVANKSILVFHKNIMIIM